jgi:hypothetical protein
MERHPRRLRAQGGEDQSHATCPAGKRLYRNGKDCIINGYTAVKLRASISVCKDCALCTQCLRKPAITHVRQVAVLTRKRRRKQVHAQAVG